MFLSISCEMFIMKTNCQNTLCSSVYDFINSTKKLRFLFFLLPTDTNNSNVWSFCIRGTIKACEVYDKYETITN